MGSGHTCCTPTHWLGSPALPQLTWNNLPPPLGARGRSGYRVWQRQKEAAAGRPRCFPFLPLPPKASPS